MVERQHRHASRKKGSNKKVRVLPMEECAKEMLHARKILRDARALLAEAGGLFEGVGHLQDAEVLLVAADDLDADGEAFRGEAAGDRRGRIASGRDVPAGFHPVDVAREL